MTRHGRGRGYNLILLLWTDDGGWKRNKELVVFFSIILALVVMRTQPSHQKRWTARATTTKRLHVGTCWRADSAMYMRTRRAGLTALDDPPCCVKNFSNCPSSGYFSVPRKSTAACRIAQST